uniref:Secreted protein n=1 Tax=Knipowitschia caucasica TaxID=637954 RepID=A0AAV2JFF6_KNICA
MAYSGSTRVAAPLLLLGVHSGAADPILEEPSGDIFGPRLSPGPHRIADRHGTCHEALWLDAVCRRQRSPRGLSRTTWGNLIAVLGQRRSYLGSVADCADTMDGVHQTTFPTEMFYVLCRGKQSGLNSPHDECRLPPSSSGCSKSHRSS